MASKEKARWVVAMRLGGEARKLFKLHITKTGDYYIALLHSNPPDGFSRLDRHMSYHQDGRRHLTVKAGGKKHPGTAKTVAMRQPTSDLKGVEALLPGAPLFKWQFSTLEPLSEGDDNLILLDADTAGFRDDYLLLRAFLVEPHQEHLIPTPPDVGPRVLYIERSVKPWIVVEAFQEHERKSL